MNNYQRMVKDLIKPGEDILATLTPERANLMHMALALTGEAGELLEHYCLDKHTIDSSIIEELGDGEFYLEGICQAMCITIALSGSTSQTPLSIPRYAVAATEVLDAVKKMVIYNKDIDLMDLVNKLTEVRVCLDRVYSYYSITQEEALAHNMHKLLKGDTARYKDGVYSDEAAQLRSDKQAEV
jgi:NTP pyrophosphatase (non-canonical NTP hydrolase)